VSGVFRCPHTCASLSKHTLTSCSGFCLCPYSINASSTSSCVALTSDCQTFFCMTLPLFLSLSCCIFGCIIYVRMRPCVGEMQALLCSPLCSCYCCQCSCAVSGQSISLSLFLSHSLSPALFIWGFFSANWEVHSLNSFTSYLILLTKFLQSIWNSSGLALHLEYHEYLNSQFNFIFPFRTNTSFSANLILPESATKTDQAFCRINKAAGRLSCHLYDTFLPRSLFLLLLLLLFLFRLIQINISFFHSFNFAWVELISLAVLASS